MDPLIVKGLLGFGAVGALCCGTWMVMKTAQPSSIGEYIIKVHGMTFPSFSEGSDKNNWDRLVEANNNLVEGLRIDIDSGGSSTDKDAQRRRLQEECRNLSRRPMSEATVEELVVTANRCTLNVAMSLRDDKGKGLAREAIKKSLESKLIVSRIGQNNYPDTHNQSIPQ